MNAQDVLRYGHATFVASAENVPHDLWMNEGVCGVWSTRDVVAHIASYELVLGDILASFAGLDQEGYLDEFLAQGGGFNDTQVEKRHALTASQALDEYQAAFEKAIGHARLVNAEEWRRPGTLPWYGPEYSLDDLMVYQYYGHKREHAAQLDAFLDRLERDRS